MNRITVFLAVLLVIATIGIPAVSNVSVAVAAAQWTAIPAPQLVGVGAVRAIAATGDGATVFAVVTNLVASNPPSYMVRTIDGGLSWEPWGNFNPTNLASATIILVASPNYTLDKTLFVAVAYPVGTMMPNQIWYSSGGGGFQLLGGVSFPPEEVIRTIAVSPQSAGTFTVAVGTVNPLQGRGGNLYVYSAGRWKKILFGDAFSPTQLDIYFAGFIGNWIELVASQDTSLDSYFYVYRLGLTAVGDAIPLPTSPPNLVRLDVSQASDQLSPKFSVARPSNWALGARDTELIAYGIGSTGTIFRRRGTIPEYRVVHVSNTVGYTNLVMTGSSEEGVVFASGLGWYGGQAGLVRSTDGGRTWSVVSGSRSGIDGSGGEAFLALGGGILYVATGGVKGGVFKSTNQGFNWSDTALYNDSFSTVVDWLVERLGDRDVIYVIMTDGSNNGAIFRTTDRGQTWQRVSRFPTSSFNLAGSKLIKTNPTLYCLLGASAGTSFIGGQILRSEDGINWTTIGTDPSDTWAVTNIVSGYDTQTILAQLSNNAVVRSADGGNRWKPVSFSPSEQLVQILLSPVFERDGTLLGLGVTSHQAYISRDYGESWKVFGGQAPGTGGGVVFHPGYETNRMIYATSSSGIYFLRDDGVGTDWQRVSGSPTGAVGKPVMAGNALYVPAGNAIAVSDDVAAAQPKWRSLPLTAPARSGVDKISLQKVDGLVKVYTAGVANNISVLTDTPPDLPTPTPIATPGPGATPTPGTPGPVSTPTATVVPSPGVSITEQLVSIIGSGLLKKVWGYTPDYGWALFDPKVVPFEANSLRELKTGMGYWFLVDGPCKIVFSGTEYDLVAGWNLIGWGMTPTTATAPITEQLASIIGNLKKVWGYELAGWSVFDPKVVPLEANSLRELKPGMGYWILTTQASRIDFAGNQHELGTGGNLIGWR